MSIVSADAPMRLLKDGPIGYIGMDYLAEKLKKPNWDWEYGN